MYRTGAIQCRFVYAEWGGCAAPLRRADITAGKRMLRKRSHSAEMLPSRQRVNICLAGAVIEHFRSKTADRGHQTLINPETLRSGSGRLPT